MSPRNFPHVDEVAALDRVATMVATLLTGVSNSGPRLAGPGVGAPGLARCGSNRCGVVIQRPALNTTLRHCTTTRCQRPPAEGLMPAGSHAARKARRARRARTRAHAARFARESNRVGRGKPQVAEANGTKRRGWAQRTD